MPLRSGPRVWAPALLALAATGLGLAQAPPADSEDPHRRRSTIYIANRGSAEVTALGRDSGELIATIPVGKRPSGLAARFDGDRIYVVCAGSHTLQVIDGVTRSVLDTVTLTHGAAPAHVVLSPDEKTLYIAASGLDAVYAIDAASLQQTADVPVSGQPIRLAISRDGGRLYVLCVRSSRVDVIDTSQMKVIASPAIGSQPSDITLDRDTGRVYVISSAAPSLRSLDEGVFVPREIALEAPGTAITFDGTSRRLMIASPGSGKVFMTAPSTGAAVKVMPLAEVTRMAADPDGKMLYCLSARRGVLVFLDRILGTVQRTVTVGKEPWDIVLIP